MNNDVQSFSTRGFIVWGICTFFFLFDFFLRTVLGTFQSNIMLEIDINAFEFSLLSTTLFSIIYALLQIPAGIFIERYGLKKSILLSSLLCTFSCWGLSISCSFKELLFFRTLMGAGSAFGFIGVLIAATNWMPKHYLAFIIGITQFIGTLGPMLASAPLELYLQNDNLGWRDIFMLLSHIALCISSLSYFFVENNKRHIHRADTYNTKNIISGLKSLCSQRESWLIALLTATLYCPIEYLTENAGHHFLELKNLDWTYSSFIITSSWLAYAICAPLWGLSSDLCKKRKIFIQLASLASLCGMILLVFSSEVNVVLIGFILLGVGTSGQTLCYSLIIQYVEVRYIALAFAFNNAFLGIINALNAPLIGYFIDKQSHDYSLLTHNDYIEVFYILIFVSLTALICSSLIEDKNEVLSNTSKRSNQNPTIDKNVKFS